MSTHAAAHAPHRNYVRIWAILVVLLAVSVFGPMLGIRLVTLITAFGIALVKAYLVAKNFMHLDIEKPIVHWMLLVALVFMVLMFSGISPDVMRDNGRSWHKGAGFHPVERVGHEQGHAPAEEGHAPAKDGHTGTPSSGEGGSQGNEHGGTGGSP